MFETVINKEGSTSKFWYFHIEAYSSELICTCQHYICNLCHIFIIMMYWILFHLKAFSSSKLTIIQCKYNMYTTTVIWVKSSIN